MARLVSSCAFSASSIFAGAAEPERAGVATQGPRTERRGEVRGASLRETVTYGRYTPVTTDEHNERIEYCSRRGVGGTRQGFHTESLAHSGIHLSVCARCGDHSERVKTAPVSEVCLS